MEEVDIPALLPERFDPLLGARAADWSETLARARRTLGGRTLWHINSTSKGGGVAEMLQSVLCYLVGAGIDTRWLVIGGNDDFFDLTKQIHFLLHGAPSEATELGPPAGYIRVGPQGRIHGHPRSGAPGGCRHPPRPADRGIGPSVEP